MGTRGRLAGFDLVHLLLVVTVAELAFNRLAVPALRPPGTVEPPAWHTALDHLGLFLMYFASTLAIGVVARRLWHQARSERAYWLPLRWTMLAVGLVFVALAAINIVISPGDDVSFAFESLFTVLLVLLAAMQLTRGGDLGVKLGLILLIAPLVVHYYGPFALRYVEGPAAVWGDLPSRVQSWGHWSMVFAALVSPYCFAPRPFVRSAARLAPLTIAMFVGVLGAVVLRQHYEVGMLLASRGLGIDLGPGAPDSFLALNLLALASVTWTMASCLTAETHGRREIGVGLALVVVGGYGFIWPLQYLVSFAGLLNIGHAAQRVGAEESSHGTRGYRAPPIADEVWQSFVRSLVSTLGERAGEASRAPGANAITSEDEEGVTITRVVGTRRGVDFQLRVERTVGAIAAVDVRCGGAPPTGEEPAWTMYARPERLLGMGSHPPPPPTAAPARRTGDEPFDQRFRVHDSDDWTERLLDEGLRARSTALVDGWLAFWPERGLRYLVHPGHGAPLDHPIPITELAFRGIAGPDTAQRLLTLLDLLVDIADRGLRPAAPPTTEPS